MRGERDGRSRVIVLNSYTLTGRRPGELVRIRAFLEGLAAGGYRAGENLEVEILDSNDLAELGQELSAALDPTPQLIHAVGTPNALMALERAPGIPVVYYGAHPEGVGEAECRSDRVRGVVLTLPFTSHYKSYRFVRRLLPGVERVYVPFFEETVFCRPAMREKHRRHRAGRPSTPWIPAGSELIGFRSLAGLNEIVDLDYRELVYRNAADLEAALAAVDPRGAFLMPYNDSVYCRDAPRILTAFAADAGMPLIWNNNPEATRIGALAAIAGCFREAGYRCGRQAAQILATGTTAGVESTTSTRSYSSLNLARARELGLELGDEVLAAFDEVLPAPARTTPQPARRFSVERSLS